METMAKEFFYHLVTAERNKSRYISFVTDSHKIKNRYLLQQLQKTAIPYVWNSI